MSFTFRHDRAADGVNPASSVQVTVEYDDISAADLVEYFEQFLRACGYSEQTIREVIGGDE